MKNIFGEISLSNEILLTDNWKVQRADLIAQRGQVVSLSDIETGDGTQLLCSVSKGGRIYVE